MLRSRANHGWSTRCCSGSIRATKESEWATGSWWRLATRAGWELYDLAADRTELNDLADRFPERVRDMRVRYERWAAESGILSFDDAKGLRDQKRRQRDKLD